jgi:hypothetical protein
MKRAFLILTLAALALPTTAVGKGPSEAVLSGPGGGGGGGITFGDDGQSGVTPLGELAEQSGFFPAVFQRQPDPMLDARPTGDLGPKYTMTWKVPGPNNETWTIEQDVYPYASRGPVTHTAPGQEVFQIPGGTRGGWFQADSRLKETLVAAGLPETPSIASGDDSTFPAGLASLFAAALLLAAATALLLRRRARPAAA